MCSLTERIAIRVLIRYMRRLILLLIAILGMQAQVYGQVVTTRPEFPTADDSVTIYFDATKGTQGLKDFTGDVYAHTGVITDQSSGDLDWKYVVSDWGVNTPKIKMKRVDTNRYALKVGSSIRAYYGVPQGEKIEKMAFVFRNSDGTKEAKAEGGNDIFANVYVQSFNVKIVQPQQDLTFLNKKESLSILGISSGSSGNIELSLSIGHQEVKKVNNDTIRYTYNPQSQGSFELSLAGTDGTQTDTAAKKLVVNPDIINQKRPDSLKDGITYVDDSTVRLSLFAPHKKFVYVIGDFNNWQVQPQYFMHRDSLNADSVYYWTEISGLTPGKEYAFQYLVDGKIRVTDPYVHKILDPNNDKYISDVTYPNLKPYPAGKTKKIVGVLQPGKEKYVWQNKQYQRPDKKNLVTYELLVRDFIKKHDYKTLTDTLDYLDRLGVNAIELMPVMEFDGNNSWGYNPTFHLAADKYYGPADDLKKFIDACHSRGIAVILDMVLNHAWGASPLVRLWNEGDYGKPTAENPYLNTEPRHDFNVGYDFNHESKATQYFVDRVNDYWMKEFKFDGFRFDLAKGFTQKNTLGDVNAFGQYDASRIKILERMADHIWSVDDSAYVILEEFAENKEEKELSNFGMMLWGNLNGSYNEATMGYYENNKSDFSGIYYGNRGWSKPHLIGYMESHDEERLMYKNLQYGNSNADNSYDITRLSTALNRVKMAGAFFFTIPGPKMIWQFGELGYDISIDENGRTGEKPIKWEYYSDSKRKKLYDTFKALITLRKADSAFTSAQSQVQLDLAKAVKRMTIKGGDMDVSIVGNFGVNSNNIKPDFAEKGKWFDYFSGDSLNVTHKDTAVTLKAGEFHIYTTKKFKKPEGDLLSGGGNGQQGGEGTSYNEFKLFQNYPNPFNPSTKIEYTIAEPSNVKLDIYNVLGQKVATLLDKKQQQPGAHEVTFNGLNLSSGVYLYRLEAGSRVSTKKMLLIR